MPKDSDPRLFLALATASFAFLLASCVGGKPGEVPQATQVSRADGAGACYILGFTGWQPDGTPDDQESRARITEINSDGGVYRIVYETAGVFSDRKLLRYYQWEDVKEDVKKAAGRGERLILVGHSAGGAAALKLARWLNTEGRRVELLIELDTYTGGIDILERSPDYPLLYDNGEAPPNVKLDVNYYQTSGLLATFELGETTWGLGLKNVRYDGRPQGGAQRVINVQYMDMPHSEVDDRAAAEGARDYIAQRCQREAAVTSTSTPAGTSTRTPTPAPTPVATPAQTYEARPLDNGIIFGDFSVALSRVDRLSDQSDYDTVKASFALRRINRTEYSPVLLYQIVRGTDLHVEAVDDHENIYSADWLEKLFHPELGDYSQVPVGFTWVETFMIRIPRPAPIKKIQLSQWNPSKVLWEIDYASYRPATLDLNGELREGLISSGDTFAQGEFLGWSVGKPKLIDTSYTYFELGPRHEEVTGKDVVEWLIPFEVENRDYNPRTIELWILVQERDGELRSDEDYEYYAGYFYDNPEEDPPDRPESYSFQAEHLEVEIPPLTKVSLMYYRVPSLADRPEDMPDKLLIFPVSRDVIPYILKLRQ